jgi:serine/threonine protein kinase
MKYGYQLASILICRKQVADPERKQRFIQEAKSASALNHPHIVTIHDISNDNGIDFIVMEYVTGKSLEVRRKSVFLTPPFIEPGFRVGCHSGI